MPRRKKKLRPTRDRLLLSDVLPYEVPLSFTNRHFHKFIVENHVIFEGAKISWLDRGDELDALIHLLFSLPQNPHRLTTGQRQLGGKSIAIKIYDCEPKPYDGADKKNNTPAPENFLTPFGYKINHKQSEFRELTVPHPRSQMRVVEFYDQCKESILHYTSLSEFSIRHPAKVASHTYMKDRLHYERLAEGQTIVEEQDKEYESLKSFFAYKDFSNIYKFYESYQYHRCEKKYDKLIKLDISKCFDSIYTHSITWALLGKEATKESLRASADSFAGRFDTLMQHMHYGETNGIIIGPEFSRIFAELILQRVDTALERKLRGAHNLSHRIHYEIFRYVDDYFLFCNEDQDSHIIVEELQHILREYKLYLNSAKAVTYEKPIITEITIAKNGITKLLSDKVQLKMEAFVDKGGDQRWKGSIRVDGARLITDFKSIIKTSKVEYKDLLNYSLAILERRLEKVLNNYSISENREKIRTDLIEALSNILDFSFFIYSVSPRVNTTIRLCRLLRVVCEFLKGCPKEDRLFIHKQIFDEVNFILRKNRQKPSAQVETLYLLISLSELGKPFWLEEQTLRDYLQIDKDSLDGEKHNYFSIVVALFYIKSKVRYKTLRENIETLALSKIRSRSDTRHKDAEMIMLALDLVACPYASEKTKRLILDMFGISNFYLQTKVLNYRSAANVPQIWFTSWSQFDFGKELDAKQSQEVY